MRRLNLLFTLNSIIAFIVIAERLPKSPTAHVLLQPYNFIRLHEINQTVIFLLGTTIVTFLMLVTITNNFQTVKNKFSTFLVVLFVAGAYLYGAGEGWHEVASFTFNTYCNVHTIIGNLCHGLFINDYYSGNLIFFVGNVMMNIAILALEKNRPSRTFSNKELTILFANCVVYAFTWFAYAAFDVVLVGLIFSFLLMLISGYYFFAIKRKYREYPYITYSVVAYILSTVATLLVKFH